MYASSDILGIENHAWKYAHVLALILDILPTEKNN
jgi:hypothetical protein